MMQYASNVCFFVKKPANTVSKNHLPKPAITVSGCGNKEACGVYTIVEDDGTGDMPTFLKLDKNNYFEIAYEDRGSGHCCWWLYKESRYWSDRTKLYVVTNDEHMPLPLKYSWETEFTESGVNLFSNFDLP